MNAYLSSSKLLVLCILLCVYTYGQETTNEKASSQVRPDDEMFEFSTGLIIPWGWLWHTCWAGTANPRTDCPVSTDKQFRANSYQRIYSDDGNIWYAFSVFPGDANHYASNPHKSFMPLGPYPISNVKLPGPIVMRIHAESDSWYEVEINEDTRKSKFVSKLDPSWSKVDWADIFNLSKIVSTNGDNKVLEEPNGKPVQCSYDPGKYTYVRLDGDWMRVNDGYSSTDVCKGWIRWRIGRDVIVGTVLNGWQKAIPIH